MRVAACGADDCLCERACNCALTCAVDDCKPACRGPGTTCTIDVAAPRQMKAECSAGSSCRAQVRGPAGEVAIDCKASSCELSCGTARNCLLECKDASRCLLRCESAAKCEIKNCGGGQMLDCGGGVTVCGRACP
jgi:hypothetical protein